MWVLFHLEVIFNFFRCHKNALLIWNSRWSIEYQIKMTNCRKTFLNVLLKTSKIWNNMVYGRSSSKTAASYISKSAESLTRCNWTWRRNKKASVISKELSVKTINCLLRWTFPGYNRCNELLGTLKHLMIFIKREFKRRIFQLTVNLQQYLEDMKSSKHECCQWI